MVCMHLSGSSFVSVFFQSRGVKQGIGEILAPLIYCLDLMQL